MAALVVQMAALLEEEQEPAPPAARVQPPHATKVGKAEQLRLKVIALLRTKRGPVPVGMVNNTIRPGIPKGVRDLVKNDPRFVVKDTKRSATTHAKHHMTIWLAGKLAADHATAPLPPSRKDNRCLEFIAFLRTRGPGPTPISVVNSSLPRRKGIKIGMAKLVKNDARFVVRGEGTSKTVCLAEIAVPPAEGAGRVDGDGGEAKRERNWRNRLRRLQGSIP